MIDDFSSDTHRLRLIYNEILNHAHGLDDCLVRLKCEGFKHVDIPIFSSQMDHVIEHLKVQLGHRFATEFKD